MWRWLRFSKRGKTRGTWFHLLISCSYHNLFSRVGEDGEMAFCRSKWLNYMTLRMTWEAKDQLKSLLINSGFPEAALIAKPVSNVGIDSNLDLVSLLVIFFCS